MKASRMLQSVVVAALMPLALILVSCDADTPTAPASQAQNPSTGGGTTAATWNVVVTVSPDEFTIGDSQTTGFIEVSATRVSNGALVPEGTTAVLSASAGSLTTSAGNFGSSVPIQFDETGTARATISVSGFDSPGTVTIRAQLESSFGSDTIRIVETPDDTSGEFGLTQISPSFGPPAGGTLVTVTGSQFQFPMKAALCQSSSGSTTGSDCVSMTGLTIQGTTSFTALTPRIDLPAGENLTVNLVVEKDSFTTDSLPNAFTYTRNTSGPAQLLLISVTPSSGPNEGGTQVTIRGDGFNQEAQVFFSNGPLIEATVLQVTSTSIQAITPSATGPNSQNANSIVDILVRDPISGQQATLASAFQYGTGGQGGMFISAVGPDEVPYFGGVLVTIFGQGFDEPVAISAGGIGQSPISVTGTQIVFNANAVQIESCSAESGPVGVTNIETGESVTGQNFTYRPIEPVILSVSPGSGPEAGGNTVVINGAANGLSRGFDPPVRVRIDGRLATVTSVSADGTAISVIAPQFAGTFDTEPCTDGSGGAGTRQLDTAVDVEVENTPTECTDTETDAYVYRPASNVCTVLTPAVGPSASFTSEAVGLTVTFTDTSTAGSASITTWAWNFGDGGNSSSQNTSHVYAAPGTYTITLTVTDGNGLSSTSSQDITL